MNITREPLLHPLMKDSKYASNSRYGSASTSVPYPSTIPPASSSASINNANANMPARNAAQSSSTVYPITSSTNNNNSNNQLAQSLSASSESSNVRQRPRPSVTIPSDYLKATLHANMIRNRSRKAKGKFRRRAGVDNEAWHGRVAVQALAHEIDLEKIQKQVQSDPAMQEYDRLAKRYQIPPIGPEWRSQMYYDVIHLQYTKPQQNIMKDANVSSDGGDSSNRGGLRQVFSTDSMSQPTRASQLTSPSSMSSTDMKRHDESLPVVVPTSLDDLVIRTAETSDIESFLGSPQHGDVNLFSTDFDNNGSNLIPRLSSTTSSSSSSPSKRRDIPYRQASSLPDDFGHSSIDGDFTDDETSIPLRSELERQAIADYGSIPSVKSQKGSLSSGEEFHDAETGFVVGSNIQGVDDQQNPSVLDTSYTIPSRVDVSTAEVVVKPISHSRMESTVDLGNLLVTEETCQDTYDIFIFSFGCVVFWNLPTELTENMFLERLEKFAGDIHEEKAQESASDDMTFVYSIGMAQRTTVKRDEVELVSFKTSEKLAVSFAFAQSCLLSVYEWRLEQTIRRNEQVPEQLMKIGRIDLNREQISMEIGRLFIERNSIVLESVLLDSPEIFWVNNEWEDVYRSLTVYFDYANRLEVLNKRLDCVHELLGVLMSEAENSHATKLEWIVIILIMVEVVIQVVWNMLFKDILGWFRHGSYDE